ncbi:response regulator [candidate division WOR-3 bacterium]|nr:response regulator [candidate division WOR-3 bacterium]
MKKKKILVIEDDYDLSALMIRHLHSSDYNVLNVGDAIQGVQFARKEIPDLIILDLMIPGGGGLNVLERLNRLSETQSIPIIVLTGIHDAEMKKKVLEAGAIEYLEKPYNAQELLRSVEEHIVEPDKAQEEAGSVGKILIVDDDTDFVKKLSLDLHRANYTTFVAYDVDQGMRLAREEKPALIILDLLLPGGGGFTFLKNLKNLVYTQNIPVIVLTAVKDEEYRQKMMEAGVKYYIEKPYDLSFLLNAIEVAI